MDDSTSRDLELARQVLIHGQEAIPGMKLCSHLGAFMHLASPGKTPWGREPVQFVVG